MSPNLAAFAPFSAFIFMWIVGGIPPQTILTTLLPFVFIKEDFRYGKHQGTAGPSPQTPGVSLTSRASRKN
jgi:hypothetical protein